MQKKIDICARGTCLLGEKGTWQSWGSPEAASDPSCHQAPSSWCTHCFLLPSSFPEQLPAGQTPPAWHWLCQGELKPVSVGTVAGGNWFPLGFSPSALPGVTLARGLEPAALSTALAGPQGGSGPCTKPHFYGKLSFSAQNMLHWEQRPLQGSTPAPAALVLPVPQEVLAAQTRPRGHAKVWGRLIPAPGQECRGRG